MSRSWAEFLGDGDAPPEEESERGWFRRLRESLAGSRRALTQDLLFDPADEASWERVEEALLQADVGVQTTEEIVERVEKLRPKTH